MTTEAEAEKQQCCSDITNFCAGSACMAWRWTPLKADQAFSDAVAKVMREQSATNAKAAAYVNANRAEFGLPTKPFEGYCGLAGPSQVVFTGTAA